MKNIILKLIICILVITQSCMPVFSQNANNTTNSNKPAKELTSSSKIKISTDSDSNKIKDNNINTKANLDKGSTIKISSKQKIKQLYIIWDKPISKWILNTKYNRLICGTNNFMHEYINLEIPSTSITINIPKNNTIICDIFIFSEGETPSWIQKWSKPYKKADMLFYPTHADDEFIFFGGAIPYYAGELGLKVQLVYMTNHWKQPYRYHEMLNGLWNTGITAYPVIGDFDDIYSTSLEDAKKDYNYDELVKYAVTQIRRFKPMVILGHDINGEYGHGAHMICARSLIDALAISADKTKYPEIANKHGIWEVPKTYLHLYNKNQIIMNWNTPLKKFDNKTGLEMAKHGFSFHQSQHRWINIDAIGGTVYDCVNFGLYKSNVGKDVLKNDFLENITLPKEPIPVAKPVQNTEKLIIKNNEKHLKKHHQNKDPFFIKKYIPYTIVFSIILLTLLFVYSKIMLPYKRHKKK